MSTNLYAYGLLKEEADLLDEAQKVMASLDPGRMSLPSLMDDDIHEFALKVAIARANTIARVVANHRDLAEPHARPPQSPQEPADWQTQAEDTARAIEHAYHRGWADALRRAYEHGPGWVIEQVMSLSPDLPVPGGEEP